MDVYQQWRVNHDDLFSLFGFVPDLQMESSKANLVGSHRGMVQNVALGQKPGQLQIPAACIAERVAAGKKNTCVSNVQTNLHVSSHSFLHPSHVCIPAPWGIWFLFGGLFGT